MKDMFSKDPEFCTTTHETHTNCKRLALRIWSAANLQIPKDFKEEHVAWLKDYWFDDDGIPISGAEEKELITNWQILYKSHTD